MRKLVLFCCSILASATLNANIMVTETGISWSDDGWYEVQHNDDFNYVCQGGTSCDVGPGVYNVINHTTGERWENITVGIQISGTTLSFPDDGWYQVQVYGDSASSVCNGDSVCTVEPGFYTIINHTSGLRWDKLEITPGISPDTPPSPSAEPLNDEASTPSTAAATAAPSQTTASNSTATLTELVEAAAGIASPSSSLSLFDRALRVTGLNDSLNQPGDTYTVFAPTDQAFSSFTDAQVEALFADTETLRQLLLHHLLLGPSFSEAALTRLSGFEIASGTGDMLMPIVNSQGLTISGADVSEADIFASNGVIHFIDQLLPQGTSDSPMLDDPSAGPGSSDSGGSDNTGSPTITELAMGAQSFSGNTGFSMLVLALQATGLDEALNTQSVTYTVFAPTDAAFEALGDDVIAELFADTARLRSVLLNHVVVGDPIDSSGLTDGRRLGTAGGQLLTVTSANASSTSIDNVNVSRTDLAASNGIVHVVDRVLLPSVNSSSGFLEDDSQGAGIGNSSDEDSSSDSNSENTDAMQPQPSTASISQTLADAGVFTTLLMLLEAADLVDVLDSMDGIYTLLAPTDSAFETYGRSKQEELLANPETLRNTLLYHVFSGRAFSAEDLIDVDGRGIVAGNGDVVAIRAVGSGGLSVNSSRVSRPDIRARNGVIHAINTVLTPTVN